MISLEFNGKRGWVMEFRSWSGQELALRNRVNNAYTLLLYSNTAR